MTNHSDLEPERWRRFSVDQQILMIGNEMNRASKFMAEVDRERRQSCYERALQLADLTISEHEGSSLGRELRLWRGVIADLRSSGAPEPGEHKTAFKLLLQMTPVAAEQISHLGL